MSLAHRFVTTMKPRAKSLVPERLYLWRWSCRKPDRRYM